MDNDEPSLEKVWSQLTGYQRTFALKAAVELDVFAHVGAGAGTIDELAKRCGAAPRGLRALLNHLVADGLLARDGAHYRLTPTSETFLNPNGMSNIGSAAHFITSPMLVDSFARLTDAVRKGGTAVPEHGTLAPEHPVWVDFARAMGPVAGMTGVLLANLLDIERAGALQVLDIAAGHGMFGIAVARMNPQVTVTALDWKNVLVVAEENARAAELGNRFRTLPGSALEIDFGQSYDIILVPNFLHHFDPATCERFLAKTRAALTPGGRTVIVEFVPDDDRSGPSDAVRFALVMLATTPAGDAYTYAEYKAMLRNAGFAGSTLHDLLPSPARVVIAQA